MLRSPRQIFRREVIRLKPMQSAGRIEKIRCVGRAASMTNDQFDDNHVMSDVKIWFQRQNISWPSVSSSDHHRPVIVYRINGEVQVRSKGNYFLLAVRGSRRDKSEQCDKALCPK